MRRDRNRSSKTERSAADLRAARQQEGNYKYAKSWVALALPVAYCVLDAAGTFADNRVLETLNEDSANVAYESGPQHRYKNSRQRAKGQSHCHQML